LKTGPRKLPVGAPAAPRRWEGVARTWTGVIAICFLAGSIVVLVSTYVRARLAIPAEQALVTSLKEKSKTDAEIQKILQPELDRQHKAAISRRLVYGRGGGVLIISGALFIFWFLSLRPKRGTGAGVPGCFLSLLERPPDVRKKPV
jgi:hypothetical protein